MKKQFVHKFSTSFLLWFEYFLNSQGEIFKTQDVTFKKLGASKFYGGFNEWKSQFEGYVYDKSIKNAVVPTKYTDGDFSADIQFQGGSLFSKDDLDGDITINCSPLECQIAFSELSEGEIIDNVVEEAFEKRKKNKNVYCSPRIILCTDNLSNEAFAFGGLVNTTVSCKAVIFSQDQYFLDGVLSVFADSLDELFPEVEDSDYPLNEMGCLKDKFKESGYSYEDIYSKNCNKNINKFVVNRVICSKANDKIQREATAGFRIGFIEFDIECERYRG